jgi:26S proteasome regulatory subunit N3
MVATPAATQDVEMEVAEVDPETLKKDADLSAVTEIREHAKQIDKAVASKEPRFILRVLRSLPNTRRKLNANVLRGVAAQLYPSGAEREAILVFVEDLPAGTVEPEVTRPRGVIKTPLPEVDAYFHLLALVRLLDAKLLEKASNCGKLEGFWWIPSKDSHEFSL